MLESSKAESMPVCFVTFVKLSFSTKNAEYLLLTIIMMISNYYILTITYYINYIYKWKLAKLDLIRINLTKHKGLQGENDRQLFLMLPSRNSDWSIPKLLCDSVTHISKLLLSSGFPTLFKTLPVIFFLIYFWYGTNSCVLYKLLYISIQREERTFSRTWLAVQ